MDPEVFVPVYLLIVFGLIIVIAAVYSKSRKKGAQVSSRYHASGRLKYVPGQFSGQMELDLRLPFRRFRQLYPEVKWTYEEYKRVQMQRAFRRSMSSQDNKRMVR